MLNKSTIDNSKNISVPADDIKTIKQTTDIGKEKFQLARRNTIKTLLIVGLCFIICWSQNQIIYFMHSCGYEVNFNTTYFQFTVVMVFLNCIVNPFIYIIKYRDYQEALRYFFQCIKEQEGSNSLNPSTISSLNLSRIGRA